MAERGGEPCALKVKPSIMPPPLCPSPQTAIQQPPPPATPLSPSSHLRCMRMHCQAHLKACATMCTSSRRGKLRLTFTESSHGLARSIKQEAKLCVVQAQGAILIARPSQVRGYCVQRSDVAGNLRMQGVSTCETRVAIGGLVSPAGRCLMDG